MDRCLPHVNTQLGIPLFINIFLSWAKGDRLASPNSGSIDFEMISISEYSRLNKINSSYHWSMLCQKSLKNGDICFFIHPSKTSIHPPTHSSLHSFINRSHKHIEYLFYANHVNVHAKLLQSCPTLCNPMDCILPLSMGFSFLEYWSG